MAENEEPRGIRAKIQAFRTSDHWAVSLARDILWVVAVVACIALALYLICGAWRRSLPWNRGAWSPT